MKSILLVSLLLAINSLAQVSPPFYYVDSTSSSTFSYDTMESYTSNANVNGLNGGVVGSVDPWNGAYVDLANAFGVLAFDTMEQYSNGNALNTLNLGNGWNGAYVDHSAAFPGLASDDMESYSNGANLNGLNGGTDNGTVSTAWNGTYVAP